MATANELNIQQPGYMVFDGVATFTGNTFVGGTGVTVTNGNGLSGATTTISLTGGGAAIEHLTGDTGGQLNPDGSNNFNLFGQQAGTVPVMDTIGSGSTIEFENRTWQTQYVVDPSTTDGLRGTFSTIAAAIAQAVIDGASSANPKTIFIRFGAYTENLTIPDGIQLRGQSILADPNSFLLIPSITGTHSISTAATILLEGIEFINNGAGDTFSSDIAFIFINNCVIFNTSTGNLFNITNLQFTQAFNCQFFGASFGTKIIIGSSYFYNCRFNTVGFAPVTNGTIRLFDCVDVGPYIGNGNNIISKNTNFTADNTDNISGSFGGSNTLENCMFSSNTNTTTGLSGTGTFQINNIGIRTTSTGPLNLYNATPTINLDIALSGNVIKMTKTAISYAALITDYYIGVTSTAALRTITLPNPCCINRSYIIKDESGGAATNNITIAGNGKNIDGAANYIIASNFGSITVVYDGTQWFII